MLTVEIPGRETLNLEHLVLDYNGTIALDGHILEGVTPRLEELSRHLKLWVITADTHGTAAGQCRTLPVEVLTYPTVQVGEIKAQKVRELSNAACIGNGFNDILMAGAAALSICVLGAEGCCGSLLARSDVVVTSILDGLDLLLKPSRLRATLRT